MGLFGDIFDASVNTFTAVATLPLSGPIAAVDIASDIVKGKNVIKSLGDAGEDFGMRVLTAAAGPTKIVHAVTDRLGVTDEFDLVSGAWPGVGVWFSLSQVAETVDDVIELKKRVKREQKKMEKEMEKLGDYFESLTDEDIEKLINEAGIK